MQNIEDILNIYKYKTLGQTLHIYFVLLKCPIHFKVSRLL